MSKIITNLLEKKGKPCDICYEMHIPQNQCRREALIKRINMLMQANSVIPSVLSANKEAVGTAKVFQDMLAQTAAVFDLMQSICNRQEYGEIGPKIWATFMFESTEEKMQCQEKSTSQDTEGQLPPIENSTLSATNDNGCIEETTNGKSSPENS